MKVISFYSYKGGVGRTLALKEMAQRLVEYGKSVMIIDFDLEAPGVPYKLNRYLKPDSIKSGIVDYISDFTENGKIGEIDKYIIELPKNNPDDAPLFLFPAGDTNVNEYWKKLSRISWVDLFYKKGGYGLRFFLDLKERIRKQYNPDFVLIDSRTGITELSGISLSILADEVIMLFVNNEENISGTQRILNSLQANKIRKVPVKKHLILTRIPKPSNDNSAEFNREYVLVDNLKKRFNLVLDIETFDINIVHTDGRLQMNENIASIVGFLEPIGISVEYIKLFEKLFKGVFSDSEWDKKENKRHAERLYYKATITSDIKEKISFLTAAVKIFNENWIYYYELANLYHFIGHNNIAIDNYSKAISLNPNNGDLYILISQSYLSMGERTESDIYINKSLEKEPHNEHAIRIKSQLLFEEGKIAEAINLLNSELELNPKYSQLYNQRANIYRIKKMYTEALKDVLKAISIMADPVYYGTLAEIKIDEGNIEEFFMHFGTALERGIYVTAMRTAKDAYEKVRKEPRFIELLKSYNINSEDIFNNEPLMKLDLDDETSSLLD